MTKMAENVKNHSVFKIGMVLAIIKGEGDYRVQSLEIKVQGVGFIVPIVAIVPIGLGRMISTP